MTLTSIAYVSNYYQGFTGNWNTPLFHSWSLCIEQQFYLLWPLGLLTFRSTCNRIRFLAFAISTVWAGRFMMVAVGAETDYIYCALETRADNILVGCLAALMLHAGLAPVFWRRVTESASVAWLMFSASGALACASYLERGGHKEHSSLYGRSLALHAAA